MLSYGRTAQVSSGCRHDSFSCCRLHLTSDRIRMHKTRLRVNELSASDNGVFDCRAQNVAGAVNSSNSFLLSVPGTQTSIPLRVIILLSHRPHGRTGLEFVVHSGVSERGDTIALVHGTMNWAVEDKMTVSLLKTVEVVFHLMICYHLYTSRCRSSCCCEYFWCVFKT